MVLWLALVWQIPNQQVNRPASVMGRVVWQGDKPQVPWFRAPASPGVNQGDPGLKSWQNPFAPTILSDGSMANVLIWVEEGQAEPRPKLKVEVQDNQIRLEQGGRTVPVGLLGLGDSITVESRQDTLFTLKARGASSFALPLIEKAKNVTRKLEKPGWVELSSGSGQYWARAWLWVGAPQKALFTDKNGSFEINGLKPGKVKIFARLPDWQLSKFERDQETGEILMAQYQKPRIQVVETDLEPGGRAKVDISFGAGQP